MDSTVEELISVTVLAAGMALLSILAVLVCFFRKANQVPSAMMATSVNKASSKGVGSEPCSKEDLTRTEEGMPCEADDKVLIGSCRSYSPPGSLVLVGVVSPLELTPLKLKQTVCLSPLSSTLPPSHVATMSLSLSPLSTITSTTHMSPTGCDSYDDDLPLFPQEEMHF